MGMENRARRLLSQRCHRNSLRLHRRKRAPRHAPRCVAVGVSRHRYYLHLHGFYFQNLCPACGCYDADGNYLCGVFLAPEISAWLAWRHGRDRGGHSSWVVAGHNDRESMEFDYGLAIPVSTGGPLWEALTHPGFLNYFSVILPMGIFNVVGSLQNIESAEAAGDRYRTFPSLMANGIGSVVAALFGSVFPTTIYIGHPGWKRLGARAGYSALNGLFISFLCFTGTIQSVLGLIPIEAGIGILLYIGIIIVAQAFQENTERTCSSGGARDCSGIGSLGTADGGNRSASCRRIAFRNRFGSLCSEFSDSRHDRTRTRVIFTSMILAAIGVALIERQFIAAAVWSLVATFLSAIGIIHAYNLTPGGVVSRFGLLAAPEFLLSYLMLALLFFAAARYAKKR